MDNLEKDIVALALSDKNRISLHDVIDGKVRMAPFWTLMSFILIVLESFVLISIYLVIFLKQNQVDTRDKIVYNCRWSLTLEVGFLLFRSSDKQYFQSL